MIRRYIQWMDLLTEKIGRLTMWLVIPMTLVAAYNAVARFTSQPLGMNLSSNALLEVQWYLFSILFLVGSAYVYKHDSHVRVDVFYSRCPKQVKLWVNFLGNFLLAIPFCLITAWACWDSTIHSWEVLEMSPDPGGLPRYPIKSLIPLSFLLLALQSLSLALRDLLELYQGSDGLDSH